MARTPARTQTQSDLETFPEYRIRPVAELLPYARNARLHSEAQVKQIAASIREFKFLNPIIVDAEGGIIAGHGRVLALQLLGVERVPTLEAAHLSDEQRRAYVMADNQHALNAQWDTGLLKVELNDLRGLGFDLSVIGFGEDFLADLLGENGAGEEPYTRKIEAPIYEPQEPAPDVRDLVEVSRVEELSERIRAAPIAEDVRRFLLLAAQRHAVFDFRAIADYYASAPAQVQALMEESALIIIDFGQAIANGYVTLSEEIFRQYDTDYPDVDTGAGE